MPMEVEIIRAKDFARLRPGGDFDFAASKAALAKLAVACHERRINRAILDLRDFKVSRKPVFSPDELEALVHTFHKIGFTKEERLAVVYVSDPHYRLNLFTVIGKMNGWHVAAFNNYEKALGWLA